MDEWIRKMWCVHAVEYYSALEVIEILTHAARWVTLEDSMLSKLNQSHTYAQILYDSIYMRYLE